MFGEPKLLLNCFNTIAIVLICTFLVCYAQHHWRRRKLYRMAAQVNGPLTLPFIGNALYFIGSNGHILGTIIRMSKDFESPVRLWLGQQLYFGIWTPADMETILNSPHALAKDNLNRFAEDIVGTGLLTAPGFESNPRFYIAFDKGSSLLMGRVSLQTRATYNCTIIPKFCKIRLLFRLAAT